MLDSLEREEDNTRSKILIKAASDVCGNGILSKSRAFDFVLSRRMISYKMREEGYSLYTIAKSLKIDHSSVFYLAKKMKEAFEIGYDYDLAKWDLFNQKIAEYEKELRDQMV